MYKTVFEGGRVFRRPSSGAPSAGAPASGQTGASLTLRYFQADQDLSRVGFIIRKKTGKAWLRNSIRRTLRRSFQEALPSLREGAWLVFDVSDKAAALRRAELRAEADRLLAAIIAGAPAASDRKA